MVSDIHLEFGPMCALNSRKLKAYERCNSVFYSDHEQELKHSEVGGVREEVAVKPWDRRKKREKLTDFILEIIFGGIKPGQLFSCVFKDKMSQTKPLKFLSAGFIFIHKGPREQTGLVGLKTLRLFG